MNNYQMFRKIQEQAKVYEEYNNFDREDLIDELEEEKRINKNNLEEIEQLNNIIENIEKYIRYWNRKGISQNTMLILNDILLIKNGMSDKVVRLKE